MYSFYRTINYLFIATAVFFTLKNFINLKRAKEFFLKKEKLFILIYGIILTGVLIFFDSISGEIIKKQRSFDLLWKLANYLGEGKIVFSVLSLIIYIFFVLKNEKVERIAGLSLISSILSGFIVQIIQTIFMRARPFIENVTALSFFKFNEAYSKGFFKADYRSFPSGHAVTSFALFFAIAFSVKNKILRTVLCIIPCLTAISRVYLNKHWFSDVIGSLVIAAWTTSFILYIQKKDSDI